MTNSYTLYSTHCPKCKALEIKLKQKGVSFSVVDDTDAVIAFGKKHEISSAPILALGEEVFDFSNAIKHLNSLN